MIKIKRIKKKGRELKYFEGSGAKVRNFCGIFREISKTKK
jgi:hypothetical protein